MDSEGRSYVAFLVILLKKNFLLEFLLYAIVQGSCRRVTGIRQKMERGKKAQYKYTYSASREEESIRIIVILLLLLFPSSPKTTCFPTCSLFTEKTPFSLHLKVDIPSRVFLFTITLENIFMMKNYDLIKKESHQSCK